MGKWAVMEKEEEEEEEAGGSTFVLDTITSICTYNVGAAKTAGIMTLYNTPAFMSHVS
jgi:hypothetical protein